MWLSTSTLFCTFLHYIYCWIWFHLDFKNIRLVPLFNHKVPNNIQLLKLIFLSLNQSGCGTFSEENLRHKYCFQSSKCCCILIVKCSFTLCCTPLCILRSKLYIALLVSVLTAFCVKAFRGHLEYTPVASGSQFFFLNCTDKCTTSTDVRNSVFVINPRN